MVKLLPHGAEWGPVAGRSGGENMANQEIAGFLYGNAFLDEQSSVLRYLGDVTRLGRKIGVSIPVWYQDFIATYGRVQVRFEFPDVRYWYSSFDLFDAEGYYDDNFVDGEDYFRARLPIGTDLGGRLFFYSERDGEPGIYLSYTYPDDSYLLFIASTLEDYLFRGVGNELPST
jgi:hypothetical protein